MLTYQCKQATHSNGARHVQSKTVDEVGSHLTQRSLPSREWGEVSVNIPKEDKDRLRFVHCIYGDKRRQLGRG